jgi:hypothetical protein
MEPPATDIDEPSERHAQLLRRDGHGEGGGEHQNDACC